MLKGSELTDCQSQGQLADAGLHRGWTGVKKSHLPT
jgi:hypothetical protein